MKVNIFARPDHSLALYDQLNKIIHSSDKLNLYTFYCLEHGTLASSLLKTLKVAPKGAFTIDTFTLLSKINIFLCKKLNLNFRQGEVFLMKILAPWSNITDCDILHYWPFYCASEVGKLKKQLKFNSVAELYEAESSFVNEIYEQDYQKYGIKYNNHVNMMIDQNKAFEFEQNFLLASEFTKKSYQAKFPHAKYHICSYGPSGFRLQKQPLSISRKKVLKFIYVGQVCVEKGVQNLLKAVSDMNVTVDLIGPFRNGQEKLFTQLIQENTNCMYHGPKRHSEVLQLLNGFDVFCLPSLADNYSLAVVEALSRGMPVIVTDNCGNADDVSKFNLGYVVKTSSVEAIKEAIESIHSKFVFDEFRHGINNFFSEDNIISYPKSVLEVYRKIMNG